MFLLICFFMLATEMVRNYKDPSIDLPVIDTVQSAAEAPAEMVINLRHDDFLHIAGRIVSPEALGPLLTAQIERHSEAGPPLRVVIRADRRQRYGRLDKILKTCRDVGLARIVLRCMPTESP